MNIIQKLLGRREYKEIGGELYIKEGFDKNWMRIDFHLKKCHPKEYDKYIESKRTNK
jgi:hypothetical protein